MQYTNRLVVNFSGRIAENLHSPGRLILVMGILLATGCASLSGTPPYSVEPEIVRDSTPDSTLAFTRLPSTRPEVKVKPRSAQLFSESLVALANSDYVAAEGLLVAVSYTHLTLPTIYSV